MRSSFDPIQKLLIIDGKAFSFSEEMPEGKLYYVKAETGFEIYMGRKEAEEAAGTNGEVCEIDLEKAHQQFLKEQTAPYKLYRYWKANGIKAAARKLKIKIMQEDKSQYRILRKKVALSKEEWNRQRDISDNWKEKGVGISVVVPLFHTPPVYLKALIHSLQEQSYKNWELILADGSSDPTSAQISMACKDDRIQYYSLEKNGGISWNTNEGIKRAHGQYIGFMDHDDLLTPDALYCVMAYFRDYPTAEAVYSDEDKVDGRGKTFFDPHFKPDLNVELLRSTNYICHFLVVKKSLVHQLGSLQESMDGAQDYDFILRVLEQGMKENGGSLSKYIGHIPRVLYHWRTHRTSTAMNPESKIYAFRAGQRALEQHYKRLGMEASVEPGPIPGSYITRFHMDQDPLISVIIPNKDHGEDLSRCIYSLLEVNQYTNLEILILENNSREPETFGLYKELEKDARIRVIIYSGEFNFSAINNVGASQANGKYLLLLNNDVYLEQPDALRRMAEALQEPAVGIVGAKLLYPDHTIQHAGVVIGIGQMAGHVFYHMPESENGYQGRAVLSADYHAVTGACLLVRKTLWMQLGGMWKALAVAWNDVDFCLRAGEAGWRVVYEAQAVWIHDESKSRGYESTPEKQLRFMEESDIFWGRYRKLIWEGDPFYNPNLTHLYQDYALKRAVEFKKE